MSLSDNLRRLARERIPTAPAERLGPIISYGAIATDSIRTINVRLTPDPSKTGESQALMQVELSRVR